MTRLITELGYVGFEVSDLARWEEFFSEGLGMIVETPAQPGLRRVRMDRHNHRFILVEGPADDIAFAGWRLPNARAMAAFIAHLNGRGVRYQEASPVELALRDVDGMVHLSDPNGVRHEFYYGPLLGSLRFISPKVQSGFVTGECGAGHVVFPTPKYREAVQFAEEVFGFALTDQIRRQTGTGKKIEFAFMHVNARHHSLAFAEVVVGPKKLHHFMVEVGSVEDVGRARDRCLDLGYDMAMDIGQHPNDNMISFYSRTPSGFLVEYGCVGTQIDVDRWQVGHYDRISEWGHRPLAAPRKAAAIKPSDASASQSVAALAGPWNVVIKTPMGDQNLVFDFAVDGGRLSGSIKGPQETNAIVDGSSSGTSLAWRSRVNRPVAMEIAFTATVAGDEICGEAKSPFGVAPFAGRRAA